MNINLGAHSLWEVITIATVSAIVSLITIVGNVLVMVSFKVNSQLKTVNNYYLLSLAAADLIIGVFSMNLYTSYILMGYWALGNLSCDLWLAVDYVASNASVMNLLVISFDRYFSITRPLTYRAKRTPRRAGVMIGMAWLVSLILRSNAKSTGSTSDEWSKAGQLTTFNSYASSEDEDRPVSPVGRKPSLGNQVCEASRGFVGGESEQLSNCDEDSFFQTRPKSNSQKSSKCVSYKFKPVPKDAHVEHQSKNGNTKLVSSTFSSAESMSAPSTSSVSKPTDTSLKSQITKRKRMVLIKEKKAAQTLSAILLAFILTWTPYNIMVLISTFCSDCIPLSLWHLGYWLCYVNSTVNPMCYALCNKNFQKTFRMLLLCRWKKKRIEEKLYWYGQNPVVSSKLT
ncbi:hypothetical protein GOODEAATRI_028342 [Goodea atripinnis]|uniref:Muscarinic acetylcholine receptor n=1 Tax=Goodea atripinnis TaxID=208336 RepID=A0ABV0N4Y7_9TELE